MAEYVIYNIFKKGRRKTKIKFLRRNEKEGKKKPRKSGSFKTMFAISKYIVREKIECG